MQLSQRNIKDLIRGASVFACGGGLSFKEQNKLLQIKRIQQLMSRDLDLVKADKLRDGLYGVTITEVGSAKAPVMDKTKVKKALLCLEKKTGKKVSFLIPGELGQEMIIIEAALRLKLPIVDTDLSGCRAVPRLSDLALVVQGSKFQLSPLVLLDRTGKLSYVPKQNDLNQDEKVVRKRVPKNEVVTLVGGMISVKLVRKRLNYGSFSKAINLGKALREKESFLSRLPTKCLVKPIKAEVVQATELSSQGFDEKQVKLATDRGEEFVLKIQNEYMELKTEDKKFKFPQMIMVLDLTQRRGLHSSEVVKGKKLVILVAEAFDFWKGKI